MRVVVFGAGAVGGVLGGHLALHKHDVLLVCRETHAAAINAQNGLRMKSATGEYFAPLKACAVLETAVPSDASCVLFTPKSNDTAMALDALTRAVPAETPVICFQNGVANEEMIAARFATLCGAVCRMTCSFIQPGNVSFRRMGRLIIGKYPSGTGVPTQKIGRMFSEAGFDVAVSPHIMQDKWLKLVVNLQSTFHAVIDNRDHDTMEFVQLKIGVLEEAKRVLKASKIKARSCDGHDATIDEMIENLRKPRAGTATPSVKVNNSTWQNLYLDRPTVENEYFHGPIIELGRERNISVPYNEVALESVGRCHQDKLGPNALRARDILAQVERGGQG